MKNQNDSESNPVILALDTSDEATGGVIYYDGGIRSHIEIPVKKGRDTVLSDLIRNLLSAAKLDLSKLNAVAVVEGPGSFTGLRVGVAFAKGLCYNLKIPILGVSAFEAWAMSAGAQETLIIPLIQARGDEVYAAKYRYGEGNLILQEEGDLYDFRRYIRALDETCYLVGSGFRRHYRDIKGGLGRFLLNRPPEAIQSAARWTAVLAARDYKLGPSSDISLFEPRYLQDFPRSRKKNCRSS